MNTPLQPDAPSPRHSSPEKSFEALIRSHSKQLENIPSEMRIAPLPPSDAEAEETKDYIRKNLGLSIAETPCSKIFLANEILERACILEGRIGEWEGIVAFMFLYKFGKILKTIYVVPADNLDARQIAKAIIWGYIDDLPPQFASSDIVSSDRFFQAKTFNLKRLANEQLLEKFKSDYQRVFSTEFAQERSGRRTAEQALAECNSALEQLREEFSETTIKLAAAYDSAYRWNLAAIGSAALLPVVVVLLHFLKL